MRLHKQVRKKRAINDHEAKQLLNEFRIPLVTEKFVRRSSDVLSAAKAIGYPLVIKGVGQNLMHKTDRGLVHLNLTSEQAVECAVQSIAAEAKSELDGFLVQPHIEGRRELVAGLIQDRQFGSLVMFGVGGVFTEVFSDISIRLAPLREADVAEMLEEIKAKALLENFRGEIAANRDDLIQTLIGLSRIAEARPDISEIDLNPLLVLPNGRVLAVDALVLTVGQSEKKSRYRRYHRTRLDLFSIPKV